MHQRWLQSKQNETMRPISRCVFLRTEWWRSLENHDREITWTKKIWAIQTIWSNYWGQWWHWCQRSDSHRLFLLVMWVLCHLPDLHPFPPSQTSPFQLHPARLQSDSRRTAVELLTWLYSLRINNNHTPWMTKVNSFKQVTTQWHTGLSKKAEPRF